MLTPRCIGIMRRCEYFRLSSHSILLITARCFLDSPRGLDTFHSIESSSASVLERLSSPISSRFAQFVSDSRDFAIAIHSDDRLDRDVSIPFGKIRFPQGRSRAESFSNKQCNYAALKPPHVFNSSRKRFITLHLLPSVTLTAR